MDFEKLQDLISERFDIDKNKITPDTDIIDGLGIDSLDIAELMLTIEDDYGITLSDEDVANIKTVGDLVKFMKDIDG